MDSRMIIREFARTTLRKLLLKDSADIALERRTPQLAERFQNIEEFGLYLHIPFCRQICPYCPYNKEIYRPEVAERYTHAVIKEVDFYSTLFGKKPVTSFYIGGGTPTTMLYSGLDKILNHIYGTFNMQCKIHMESHPNDLSQENLKAIKALEVAYLSIGVEALQDHHLKTLHRPYTVSQVRAAISRAVHASFKCVNADFIFALPNQTYQEIEDAGNMLVEMGLDQVAAYPLFTFPYTRWAQASTEKCYKRPNVFTRRKMLHILEQIFYDAGFERTSVWAFTKKGIPKYCSVTVPLYVGLGASGGSYLEDLFYLNTFNVDEYIRALENGNLPIALSLDLSENTQMAGWLYWRLYETRFKKSDFQKRFGKHFEKVYGKYMPWMALAGLLKNHPDEILLSDRGAYWIHYIQDLFSIDYISKLWGTAKQDPWPERVVL
jgi:coproporphyrinogen III oxidase-like Fe-S oxidoreductase